MSKVLVPIFLIIVVDILGMTIILPLLPFYAEYLGASPTAVGLLVSVYAACQLIGGPLLGRLSDRTGRKPLLIFSQAGTLLGFIILAYAGQLWLVFVSRIIDGFTAGNISLAQAYIADVTRPEERTKSFAIIGIAFGLGFLVGPAVSGFLAQYGYQYPIFVAIGLSATSIAATWFLLPDLRPSVEKDPSRRLSILDWGAYAEFFRRPGLNTLLLQLFVFLFSFSSFMTGFALFAERRFTWDGRPFGVREVGYIWAYVGVLGIILQGGLIGRLVRWFGEWPLVRFSFVLGAFGFVALGWTYSVPLLLIVAAVVAVATGILRPTLTSLITQVAAKTEQGSVLGCTQALQSVASIVAPFVAGALIDADFLGVWAVLCAATLVIGLFFPRPAAVAPGRRPAETEHVPVQN